MRREDYPKLRDLLDESIETERPLQLRRYDGWSTVADNEDLDFSKPIGHYRVQPAPPQPKFRPMNDDELRSEAMRGTIVAGKTESGTELVGNLSIYAGFVTVNGWEPDCKTLTYANPDHPKYGQTLQVEIKDGSQ